MDLNQLRFLESVENIKSLAQQRTGRAMATTRAREITACVQQGRQFFEAAENSPLEIRPLVQFYGMVGFAKALVLNQRSCGLSTLTKGHGLKDISAPLARLGQLKARVESHGTFVEFNDEVCRLNRACYFGPDAHPLSIPIPTSESAAFIGFELTLKDILARIPTLAKLYRYTYSEPPATESLDQLNFRECGDYFTIRLVDPELLSTRDSLRDIVGRWRARFPYLAQWRVTEAVRAWGESYITLANLRSAFADDLGDEALPETETNRFEALDVIRSQQNAERIQLAEALYGVGGGYSDSAAFAIAPLSGRYMSEFSLSYVGLFLLSSLVRYRPDTWAHAVSGSSFQDRPVDDQALALVRAFLDTNHSAVPKLVIRVLNPNEDKFA